MDALVVEIARLIVDGRWVPNVTIHEIAKREGVKAATVEEWAAGAGRMLRVGADVETYRAINLIRLDETYAGGDGKVRVAAVSEQNKMLGLHAPQKHDVTVQAKEIESLPPAALLARVRDQLAKLRELEAKLMVETGEVDVLPRAETRPLGASFNPPPPEEKQ